MKIAFFSNFLNHHQMPLCQEFIRQGCEFVFVATEKIEDNRLRMGYEDMNMAPFVLRTYESTEAIQQAYEIAKSYDVVIFGASPTTYLSARMETNKLTFRFCERSLKKGTWRRFIPKTRKKINEGYIRYKDKNLFILGASAYTSYDLSLCGFPKKKCFQWGYFPAIEKKDVNALLDLKKKNERLEILYAGRLLKLKRVMDTLKSIKALIDKSITDIHCTIIGDGEEKGRLYAYVQKHNLQDYVSFIPFMKPNEVRRYMDKADVYIFGSNFYEGWGAVVNEAMNSACALIISHAVGSAAFLVRQKENGLIYKCGNIMDLASKLEIVATNIDMREQMARNAYETISNLWTAEIAVNRFLVFCNEFQKGEVITSYQQGPLSSAKIIKNNWVKK